MTADDPRLIAVAEAIADGLTVHWPTVHGSVGSQDAARTMRELEIIAALAAVHREFSAVQSLGEALSLARAAPTASSPVNGLPWGPLVVLERVGGGSFGTVFRAWDPTLDHEVALKRLRLPANTTRSAAASIVREGQLLARVRHENVITVHGACEIDGEIGIWMEFVRGKTLEQIIRDDGPMSAREATVVGESLCRALAAVHQANLLHRDIKASNVMREAGGRIVMLDFGAGTEASAEILAETRRMVGTPLYMAPELFGPSPASEPSDIYSLGVLLFYLVTGKYPISGGSLDEIRAAHQAGRRRLLSDTRADLPRDFVQIVERALSPQPQDRPPSAGAMLNELAAVKGVWGGVRSEHVDAERRVTLMRYRMQIGAAIAAGSLVLFSALGFVTSISYGSRFGATGGLADESAIGWPIWGMRSMFAPLTLMALVSVAAMLFSAAGQFCLATVGPLRRWCAPPSALASRIAARVRQTPPDRLAKALLLFQVVAFAMLLWTFRDLLAASASFLEQSAPANIVPLRPDNRAEHQAYRQSLTLAIFLCAVGWFRLIQLRPDARHGASRSVAMAGAVVLALMLLMLTFPYRMLYQNDEERVDYDSQPCYLVGERRSDVVLFCPLQTPPWNRVVRPDDPLLQRRRFYESIFLPLNSVGPRADMGKDIR